jgi:TolB-like protein/tetratricopeptide (TPR) repeat protein
MMRQVFYEFGRFRLDAAGRLLFREARMIPLAPKAADALLLLIENAGTVIGKDELLKSIWPDTFVGEGSLTRTISILRKALANDAGGQGYIATIPKRGYRFVAPVSETSGQQAHPVPEKLMLAVLPFENLSGNKKQEYLSDGLTEELITQLGRLNPERLGVIARTSAMQYKSTRKGIQQIGRELGVAYVLEGGVRRAGNRVRVTAQLIQVSDQTHLWAQGYERELRDLLALQRHVSQAVAKEIEVKLARQEPSRPDTGAINPAAYESYLKGRYLWNKRTRDSLENSVRYFERAIELDRGYASAYAGLADSYLTCLCDGHLPPREALASAKRAAAKGLRIDETLAEAHNSLAHAHLHEFNWQTAGAEFKRAIELNPNYPAAHFYYANYLVARECFDEAIAEAQRAQALDPVSLSAGCNTAHILYHAHLYDLAIEQSLKVLDMDRNLARAHEELGRAYEQKGKYGQAILALREAVTNSGRSPGYLGSLAYAYVVSGSRKEAMKLFEELRKTAKKRYVSAYAFAIVCVGLGDKDGAFAWLRKACEEHSGALPFLKVNPRLVTLHSDVRFHELLGRVGLRS